MEVILLKDMEKLGYANDIVNVKPGYANNYLIPQGYAKAATASAKKVLAENLKQRAHKDAKILADAQALAEKIANLPLTITVKAEEGKIFGAVTAADLADALAAKGVEGDRKAITVGPVDFREIDIGTEITLDITLNAGLKNVENVDSVTVTFPSYGLTSRTMEMNRDNFVIENLPSGYTVDVLSTGLENIRIVGDSSIVADLTAEDLVGTIDLSQYSISRGQYTVSVKIYVQGRVLAWAVGSYTVEIEATPPEAAESTQTGS